VPAPSERPRADIEGVRRATRALLATVDRMTDAQARRGTLVPDWTRAEVVTHLARNADGFRGMADAAVRGERGVQYPGGGAQRTADIAQGRHTSAAALGTDLRRSCDALMDMWTRLPDDAWCREGETMRGTQTIAQTTWLRWREVEIHHLDLDLGYVAADWPVGFVRGALDERLAMLTEAVAPVDVGELRVRLEASDLDRSWTLGVAGNRVQVRAGASVATTTDDEAVDARVRGWGCDVLAWLYGRDSQGFDLSCTGARGVLELPEWFPFG
jgi:maleylpyruvate isomerase